MRAPDRVQIGCVIVLLGCGIILLGCVIALLGCAYRVLLAFCEGLLIGVLLGDVLIECVIYTLY